MSYRELWSRLSPLMGEGEAKAVARLVLDVGFGLSMTDILCGKDTQLSADDQTRLAEIVRRLENHEPVQYILEVAEFGGRRFHVAPGVLIPRPETYELCRWIGSQGSLNTQGAQETAILDIGTGSGCIACTLALEMPGTVVTAWDISDRALDVARDNSRRLGATVTFSKQDALAPPVVDDRWLTVIVSNPPYVCRQEAASMEAHVLEHEPHEALFVPDDDPLLFYRAIADYGRQALRPGGWLFFEINPLYADDLQDLLRMMAYHAIETKEDQYGKRRMIRAQR